jgi:hypothetical protein
MPRYVFHSFHYENDCTRTQQVRHMGFIEGNRVVNHNEWESLKRAGTAAVSKWIDDEMKGKSCVVVLIGSATATRPWVIHEIQRAWSLKKGVLGIHIHNLKDLQGRQSTKGANPFLYAFSQGGDQIPIHDPVGTDSRVVYAEIAGHMESWIEYAVAYRKRFS